MKAIIYFLAAVVCSCSLAVPCFAADSRQQFIQRVYGSVVLLYVQGEDGGMRMTCTATAYRKLDKGAGYRLASASHCVTGTTDAQRRGSRYFITTDSLGEKTFIPVTLIEAGDRNVGDDFSIFEVKTDTRFEVSPLGDSDKVSVGEPVVNVASPFGLGKQFFDGYVSCVLIDRPPLDAGDVHWTNVMLVSIGAGPGSSGSAIISAEQRAIIGFLVGTVNNGNIGAIVIPVSRFAAFEKAVDAGTYKKTKKSE